MPKLSNKGFSFIDTILGITILFVIILHIHNYPIKAQIGSMAINKDFIDNSEKIALSYIQKDVRENPSSLIIENNIIKINNKEYVFEENVVLKNKGRTINLTQNQYSFKDDDKFIYLYDMNNELVLKINKKYSTIPIKNNSKEV